MNQTEYLKWCEAEIAKLLRVDNLFEFAEELSEYTHQDVENIK